MLTPRLPYPPNRGDTVRSWAELEYLCGRHDVWLASLNESYPHPHHFAKVRRICRDLAVIKHSSWRGLLQGGISLLGGGCLTEGYFENPVLRKIVLSWARDVRFDAVLTFSSGMAPLAEQIDTRRVLDLCDVDSHKWRVYANRSRWPMTVLYATEARRLESAERRFCRSHDVTLVVNQREHDKLRALMTPRESDVARTCVPLGRAANKATSDQPPALPTEPIVGSVGSMFYPPNVRAINWFGRNVWPLIKQSIPAARWWIIGNRPARSVRRWNRADGVEVTGFVPDPRPYLEAMRVFINPVDGDIGVQSKLLGALALGKPAVVTPDTSAGIDHDDPPPFLIADNPHQFAEGVIRLLSDDELAQQLCRRALRTIEQFYQPHQQLWRLDQALSGPRHSLLERPVRPQESAAPEAPALSGAEA